VPGEPPANSPFVLAVGGTEFKPRPDGATGQEIPWPSGGSGVTDIPLPRPSWQKHLHADCGLAKGDFSCTKRAVPDVSATAAAVPVVETTYAGPEWVYFSGTSLSTPLWAALIALTDQELRQSGQRPVGIDELHRVLYRGDVSGGLDDLPPHGWDWTTGLGSPKSGIVPALARAIERYRG
jgi:kumamolisin